VQKPYASDAAFCQVSLISFINLVFNIGLFHDVSVIFAETKYALNHVNRCNCPMSVTSDVSGHRSYLLQWWAYSSPMIIDRLPCAARSIFQSPPIFKWQALLVCHVSTPEGSKAELIWYWL